MRSRRWLGLSAAAAGLVALAGCQSSPHPQVAPRTSITATASRATQRPDLSVVTENEKPGTTSWKISSKGVGGPDEVAGYTDHVSIQQGDTVHLFASTTLGSLRAAAYRIGYYGGKGGREVWHASALPALHQTEQAFDPKTRTVTCHWRVAATIPTDGWVPGVYLIKLTAGTTKERSRYVPLVVRSESTAGRLVLMPSTFTWQAYNDFGGRSAYHGGGTSFADRAFAVSFRRPNNWDAGSGKFDTYELPVVALAEKLGLPLAYESDFDLSTVPGLLSGARGVVIMGQAEYWSIPQRDAVEKARDSGTNLVFLGANTSYWRVRLTDADATMTIYKSTADPVYPAADTTTLWRDSPHARPEWALTGLAYNCYPAHGTFRVASPGFWGFAGTGVGTGSAFPGIVAVEIDKAVEATGVPRPLEVVASGRAVCGHTPTRWSMSYYTNAAGAGVVTTGSMGWVLNGFSDRVPAASRAFVVQVTTNLLEGAARGPLGKQHAATDNLATYSVGP